jgi:tetratricopeptide (TPR) repeat protein
VVATLGNKLRYDEDSTANVLSRPVQTPADFNWNSTYGLYLQGHENICEREYIKAKERLKACLQIDPYYTPALTDLAMLFYRSTNYDEALRTVKTALSIDTYDPAANYYYGLINLSLGNVTDAKDGFDIASLDMSFRSAHILILRRSICVKIICRRLRSMHSKLLTSTSMQWMRFKFFPVFTVFRTTRSGQRKYWIRLCYMIL